MPTAIMQRFAEIVAAAQGTLRGEGAADRVEIQVGNATCENAAGSRAVYDEFAKHVQAAGRDDIVLREVGCTGGCSREPIVGVTLPGQSMVKYQEVNREKAHAIFTRHVQGGDPVTDYILDHQPDYRSRHEFFACGSGRCCHVQEIDLQGMLREQFDKAGITEEQADVIPANCLGLCRDADLGEAAHVLVLPEKVVYRVRGEEDVAEIVEEHAKHGRIVQRLRVGQEEPLSQRFFERYGDQAFFNRQTRLALRNCGIVDPENLDHYLDVGGFGSLAQVLAEDNADALIARITESKLRGRGGGGFPTGVKWANTRKEPGEIKYIICNADEGDPGAFMDRSMLESDPFSIVEGMAIGGYAIGATQGFVYVRAEYPLAIKRLERAIAAARERGLIGKDILGSGFDFELELRLGAGAFVCGEETALIHSIEGQRGEPRIRPPYPSTSGLFGRPTCINNVETFANVPVIVEYGPDWFRQIGTEASGGTKVFALAGKVRQTGLVEVPMGTTLRQIVYDIGGGIEGGKQLKAIQTGGPAGGCLPAKWLDTPVDFDSLRAAGSIMGSGGMIVMDEDDCMVDIAKFFLTFSQDESCGKCTPCREGTKRMLEILDRITKGQGKPEDIDKLERLGKLMQKASLCGLGRAAANPILSTIEHYRDEYEAHVREQRCPAHRCVALIFYEIDPEKCVGCTLCARNCPVNCISGSRKQPHVIDQSICIKCGRCFEVCRFDAVNRK